MQSATLIGITEPKVDYIPDAEGIISYCARVSNPSNQVNYDTAAKLLAYLVKHQHWSPFEMCSATVAITTTRDIARQILRHRSFSFQEFSQRYADVKSISEGMIFREARMQDHKNRQNSLEAADAAVQERFRVRQEIIIAAAMEAYNESLADGIAKEQARVFLPEGLTPTHMYMAGTIRSWIHYIELRTGEGTQKEHREVAQLCWEVLAPALPNVLPLEELANA